MSELIKKLEEEQKCVRDANFDSGTNFCTPEGYGFIKGFDYCLSLVEKNEQPQLNENQETVLEWLKDYYKENRPFTTTFGAIRSVASIRYGFIKKNLSEGQQNQVLQAFVEWGAKETNK